MQQISNTLHLSDTEAEPIMKAIAKQASLEDADTARLDRVTLTRGEHKGEMFVVAELVFETQV